MSDEPSAEDRPTEFDWESPRWRNPDEQQGEAEVEHRFRDDGAPRARGAIDRGDSVGNRKKRDLPADGEQS